MSRKNVIITVVVVLVIVFGSIFSWLYYSRLAGTTSQAGLVNLKSQYPQYTEYVEKVIQWEQKLKEDPERVESYITLGSAWKSLADRTNGPDHYRAALAIYEEGFNRTQRKNTTFIVNAGNMAVYLKDYILAEKYYREAIDIAPGELDYYSRLAELYEYQMSNPRDKIIALYDEALKRVVGSEQVSKLKNSYLLRNK